MVDKAIYNIFPPPFGTLAFTHAGASRLLLFLFILFVYFILFYLFLFFLLPQILQSNAPTYYSFIILFRPHVPLPSSFVVVQHGQRPAATLLAHNHRRELCHRHHTSALAAVFNGTLLPVTNRLESSTDDDAGKVSRHSTGKPQTVTGTTAAGQEPARGELRLQGSMAGKGDRKQKILRGCPRCVFLPSDAPPSLPSNPPPFLRTPMMGKKI